MVTNIQNWGNSQGIRIPKSIMSELKLTNGLLTSFLKTIMVIMYAANSIGEKA